MFRRFTGVLEIAVIKSKFILIVYLALHMLGCEQLLHLDEKYLLDWSERNLVNLEIIEEHYLKYKLKTRLVLGKPPLVTGIFIDSKEETAIKLEVERALSALELESKQITFNQYEHNQTIYIDLYAEGVCLAIGSCTETYIVYVGDSQSFIGEKHYKYTKIGETNWYILKVRR